MKEWMEDDQPSLITIIVIDNVLLLYCMLLKLDEG